MFLYVIVNTTAVAYCDFEQLVCFCLLLDGWADKVERSRDNTPFLPGDDVGRRTEVLWKLEHSNSPRDYVNYMLIIHYFQWLFGREMDIPRYSSMPGVMLQMLNTVV